MKDPQPGQPPRGRPSEDLLRVVIDAYYRRAIATPDAARSRAQSAYVISAAIAGALVTAGAFAKLREQPDSVGALAACALAGWVLAAALFMYAVAAPYESPERRSEVYGSKAFIQKAIDSAEEERDTIDRRRLRAQWAALLASVLTVAAIVLATFLPHPSEFEKANVTLGRAERTRLSRLCGHRLTPVISGEIDIGSLDDGTIRFEPSNRQCIRDGATSLKEAETSYLLEG